MKLDKILVILLILVLSYQLTLLISPLTPEQKDLLTTNPTTNLTKTEYSHMQDVAQVLRYTNVFSITIVIIAFFYFKKNKDLKEIRKGGKIALWIITILTLLGLLSFNILFDLMHKLFFSAGSWIFPPESILIQTYPIKFFQNFTLKLTLIALVLAFLTKDFYKKKK